MPWNLPGACAADLIDAGAVSPKSGGGGAQDGGGLVGDPVFDHGLNLAVWIILLVKVVAVFAIVLVSVLFMVMYERKAVARLGVRYGPNRAGPNGWLQSLADGTKLLFKEAFTPRGADKVVYKAAPYLMLVPALLVFAIVPIGGTITVAGHTTRLQLADPPWGILFLLMMSGVLGLRRDAGRLGVGIQVPAARFGSGQRPAGVLRGGARPDHGHGRAGDRLAAHQRHRGLPARRVPQPLELPPHPAHPVRLVRHRHHRRDDPAAVRPGRGGGGALRRLQPGVLVDRLRLVLPGRVRGPGDQLGDHRHPVVRGLRTGPRSPGTASGRSGSPSRC